MTHVTNADTLCLGITWRKERRRANLFRFQIKRGAKTSRRQCTLHGKAKSTMQRLLRNRNQARAGASLKAARSSRYFLSSLPSRLRSLPHRRAAWLTLPLVSFSNSVM